MPLRHPAVALAKANRLESLYKHSKRPQSSPRGPDGTTERRTDRPTNRPTKKGLENMQNGFDPCSHHAKRNRTHMICKTRLCKTFQCKFKCFHCQLGTLGGHINQLPLLTEGSQTRSCPPFEDNATDEVLCVCSSVCASRSNGDPNRSLSKALQAVPAGL